MNRKEVETLAQSLARKEDKLKKEEITNFNEILRTTIENSKFCYGKEGGQGFVDKSECTCSKENPCQAIKDSVRFHASFEFIEGTRDELIEKLKPEFKDSQWFKDNVKGGN